MTEDLENALRRTLAAAAERAPKAPEGLEELGLGSPARRRSRGHARAGLAAAAVALAIGGATIGGRTLLTGTHAPGGAKDGRHPATASPSALHRPKNTDVPPIEKVWPKAVHRMPDTLPNGHKFGPVGFIDDHTLLVNTESSFEKADALYAYDLRNHHTKQITGVVTPPGTKVFASGITTGGGYVAWWLSGNYGTEIWAAPLSGGEARLVSRADTPVPTDLAIDGGNVFWSVEKAGGVFRAPVAGGPTRQVPGTRGYYILQWPWIGTPPPVRGIVAGTGFANVRNVVTGETRSAHLTDRAAWNCGLTWCVGRTSNFVSEAQRRDGSGRHAIPDLSSLPGGNPPSLDRFVITPRNPHSMALHDLRTGRTADLGTMRRDAKGDYISVVPQGPANRLYYTETDDGYVIVDLAAI